MVVVVLVVLMMVLLMVVMLIVIVMMVVVVVVVALHIIQKVCMLHMRSAHILGLDSPAAPKRLLKWAWVRLNAVFCGDQAEALAGTYSSRR